MKENSTAWVGVREMQIRFWGVRGSIPAPLTSEMVGAKIEQALLLAQEADLSGEGAVAEFVRGLPFEVRGTCGGNTSCVQVEAGDTCLVLDAGSGVRGLGLELLEGPCGQGLGTVHFLMSHTHWDHVQGFPFFLPAFVAGNRIIIHGPQKDLARRFEDQQSELEKFPVPLSEMSAEIRFVPLTEPEDEFGGFRVRSLPLHHPGGSYAYRLEAGGRVLVYATDAEYPSLNPADTAAYVSFFRGADVLIFDAMYTFSESMAKIGWGHSTAFIGVDLAVAAEVKRLVLFHHEPTYDDAKLRVILDKTRTYYDLVGEGDGLEVVLASEGLELSV